MTIKNQLFTLLVGIALLAGHFFAASAAHASVLGYEITYDMEELRMSHNGSFGPAEDSAYWGLVGQSVPDTIGFRIELSQDPALIQTYPVDQGGTLVGNIRFLEFARIDMLIDGQIAFSDLSPPTAGNSAQVINAFPIAQNRDDLFFMGYNTLNSFGTGQFQRFAFTFFDNLAPTADTWLTDVELPSASVLNSLSRLPIFRADFLGPQGGEYALFPEPNSARPSIVEISATPVPLPASAPLILAGLALLGAIGRRNSAMRISRF